MKKLTVNWNLDSSRKGLTIEEALKYIQPPDEAVYSKLKGSHPDPAVFSAAANDYVAAPAAPGYPRGANPLRMHTNTMEFATAPSHVTDLPKPPKHTPTLEEVTRVDDDEDEDAIDDAPIYSPSSGKLSRYTRRSPSSAQHLAEAGDLPEATTPTHHPAEKGYLRRLGLRNSKSGLSLLNRFSRANKDQIKACHVNENNSTMSTSQIRKSRSMYLSGILGKGDASKRMDPLPQDSSSMPFQPTEPSPLRHEACTGERPTVCTPAQHCAQKRTPPRGSTTPLERAKRRGIVGMPSDNFEEIVDRG